MIPSTPCRPGNGGDVNKLWATTNAGVYIYDKVFKVFRTAAIGRIKGVKAVSNLPFGMVAVTRPDAGKVPVPAEGSRLNGWSSSYVEFYGADGVFLGERYRKGAAFYKGRFWMGGDQ